MGVFNSVYVYKPVNRLASSAFDSGTRSFVSSKQLKKIQKQKEGHTHLDVVFEAKCAEIAAKHKADSKMIKRAMAKASNPRRARGESSARFTGEDCDLQIRCVIGK